MELQFQHQSFDEYSGLISFTIDWFDLLAVRGTLKSLLQHYSSKASILWLSAFFIVQLSHPYMTTGKTIVLTIWTFVGKMMSLLLNMLPREIDGETVETESGFIFLGSEITADGDFSHEIRRCLLLGRKAMTNLDSVLKTETLLCQQRSIQSRLWSS